MLGIGVLQVRLHRVAETKSRLAIAGFEKAFGDEPGDAALGLGQGAPARERTCRPLMRSGPGLGVLAVETAEKTFDRRQHGVCVAEPGKMVDAVQSPTAWYATWASPHRARRVVERGDTSMA